MTIANGHPPPLGHRWLSRREREESLKSTLAQVPAGAPVRVFAYGSLMWNPCFAYRGREPATVSGYRRRFSVWTTRARGTPQRPGLGLGLVGEPGECRGILYTLAPAARCPHDLAALWEREMATGVYRPCWLPVQSAGSIIPSVVFVADPAHPQFAGVLPATEVARYVAQACGAYGSCRDYLATTLAELAKIGAHEDELVSLLALVDATAGG